MKKNTLLTQLGRNPVNNPKTVTVPIHRASTVLFDSIADMNDIQKRWEADEQIPTYGIFNMPQTLALANAVAEIEGGYRSAVYSSGLAAVSGAILSCVKSGDHLLMTDNSYGPARNFCKSFLARMGVETTFYDPLIGADIEKLMRSNTTVVYTESPGSYTFEIQDIPAIAKVAHQHNATVIMDNAWATGYFFNAFEHGVDLVVQPATKYYAGHADAIIGLVISNKEKWLALKHTTNALGQFASPDECFLTLRGMRTMGLRLAQHQASTLTIARWLQTRPEVERVLYPALESDPGYALWKRDFSGASGLFGVELKPCTQTQLAAMVDHYQLFGLGYSWGGFESLVMPAMIQHGRDVRHWQGGPLVRYNIGLEDTDDLIHDLEAGFKRMQSQ